MHAKLKTIQKQLWTCPKCGRRFQRHGQSHSCRVIHLTQHFEGRPYGEILYSSLKQAVRKELGPFVVESLQCCIHFGSPFTFTAIKIFRRKIRVEFCLTQKLNSSRIAHHVQISAHRHLYWIDVAEGDEIDAWLIDKIHEAHDQFIK